MTANEAPRSDFSFLDEHDPIFEPLGIPAEDLFSSFSNTIPIKLHQLGIAIAQNTGLCCGLVQDVLNLFDTRRKATHPSGLQGRRALSALLQTRFTL